MFSEEALECGLDFGLGELVHQLMQPLAWGHAAHGTHLDRRYRDATASGAVAESVAARARVKRSASSLAERAWR
jgi:hypothetical protein